MYRRGFTQPDKAATQSARRSLAVVHPAKPRLAGFTLIELLVVIAIIGILAAVVLASLSSARERATQTALLAQAREVRKAIEVYVIDNGEPPLLDELGSNYVSTCWDLSPGWLDLADELEPYMQLPMTISASGPPCYAYSPAPNNSIEFPANTECEVGAYGIFLFLNTPQFDGMLPRADPAATTPPYSYCLQ